MSQLSLLRLSLSASCDPGEGLRRLGEGLLAHVERTRKPSFDRDGKNVLDSEAVVLIGLKEAQFPDLNCGACGDGTLKGFYCNITRPAVFEPGGDDVYADDLALDLIVYPDGCWTVMDEEEFAVLPLSPEDRQHALRGLAELQVLVRRRQGPFMALPGVEGLPVLGEGPV